LIPLSDLRRYGQQGGALQDLEMLKQSRLSVSAVKPREWHFILGLASQDDLDDEPEEDLKAVSGPYNVYSGIVARVLGEVDVILDSLSRCFLKVQPVRNYR
jgi:hypothetical protein